MNDATTATLILKEGREKPVHNRHPWIFSGAIARIDGAPAPGDLVAVADSRGRVMATAYYNKKSQIQGRILSWDRAELIDDVFWRARLSRAVAGRAALGLSAGGQQTTAYRLVNAESDGLPGLIVDRYGDTLVVQFLTLGVDRRKEMFLDLLEDLLHPAGIIERSDADARGKEGLHEARGLVRGGDIADLTLLENGLRFRVEPHHGHKTGFYLDQRDNRALVSRPEHVRGKHVLNVFAYTGGFGVYAAAAGAVKVTHVDSSVAALEIAEANIALNGLERPDDEYIAGNAFEVLRYYRESQVQFDVIILDPPKFATSAATVDKATRGYKDLNWLALGLLRPGGLLATFSCSGLVSADLFQKVVFGATIDARREAQILHSMTQAADHPILLSFPESAYLKGLLCRVW